MGSRHAAVLMGTLLRYRDTDPPITHNALTEDEQRTLTRNLDYWRPGRPYLDGVEYTIIPNRSTALLAFVTGKFDKTFPNEVTVPLMKDTRSQAPNAICEITPTSENRHDPPAGARSAHNLSSPSGDVLAPGGEGADDDGEQPV